MKSLFDETKNPIFRLFCSLTNEIYKGAKLTRKDIVRRIFSLPEFIYSEAPEIDKEKNLIDTFFKFDSKGFAKVCLNSPVSIHFSDTEISWLKTMITDDETAFLLPSDLRKKLLLCLENVKPLYDVKDWRKLRLKNKPPEGKIFSDKLAVIVEALRKNQKICCGEKIIIPCRLEYDLFFDKYTLIILEESNNGLEKISVSNLKNIKLSNEKIPDNTEELFQNFYSANTSEISLQVKNTRNSVERCFALFGTFDKKSRLQDDGTYFLKIIYCRIDEEEILEKILSLGSAVTVLSPQNIREKIIKKFLDIKNLYNEG